MPDAAWAVTGCPPGSSQGEEATLVSTSSCRLSTRQRQRTSVHRSSSRPTPDTIESRLFPRRSAQRSSANAPVGGLKPPPEGRLQRAKQPPSLLQHRPRRDHHPPLCPASCVRVHNFFMPVVRRFRGSRLSYRPAASAIRYASPAISTAGRCNAVDQDIDREHGQADLTPHRVEDRRPDRAGDLRDDAVVIEHHPQRDDHALLTDRHPPRPTIARTPGVASAIRRPVRAMSRSATHAAPRPSDHPAASAGPPATSPTRPSAPPAPRRRAHPPHASRWRPARREPWPPRLPAHAADARLL
jgi:hypothetical protein